MADIKLAPLSTLAISAAALVLSTIALTVTFKLRDTVDPDHLELVTAPPTLQSYAGTVESGQPYQLNWTLGFGNPPEFYEIEVKSALGTHTVPTLGPVTLYAPALMKSGDVEHRIRGGRIPKMYPRIKKFDDLYIYQHNNKTYYELAAWTDFSAPIKVPVKHVDPPVLQIKPSKVVPGQQYVVDWSSFAKATEFELQQNKVQIKGTGFNPSAKQYKHTPTPGSATHTYQVRAVTSAGKPVTLWSTPSTVTVQGIKAPVLKVVPPSPLSGAPFEVKWTLDPAIPAGLSYGVELLEDGSKVTLTPAEVQSQSLARTKTVTTPTSFSYQMRLVIGTNPMTVFGTAAALVSPSAPPPPPPSPTLTGGPPGASKGQTVTLSGKNLKSVVSVLLRYGTEDKAATILSATASTLTFKVPKNANFRTTHVVVKNAQKKGSQWPFNVYRSTGKFLEVKPYPTVSKSGAITLSCGSAEAVTDKGFHSPSTSPVLKFRGRFKWKKTSVFDLKKDLEVRGFTGPSPQSVVGIGGFALSPGCRNGVLARKTLQTSPPLVSLGLVNLGHGTDTSAKTGALLLQLTKVIPHYQLTHGYKILLSPDDTVAAIVSKWDHTAVQTYRVGVWDLLQPLPALFLNVKSGSEPMATDFEVIAGNKVKVLSAAPKTLPIP